MEERIKTVNIMITIPEENKEVLDFIAAADMRSRSNLINKIIAAYIVSDEAREIVGLPEHLGNRASDQK